MIGWNGIFCLKFCINLTLGLILKTLHELSIQILNLVLKLMGFLLFISTFQGELDTDYVREKNLYNWRIVPTWTQSCVPFSTAPKQKLSLLFFLDTISN